MHLKGLLLAGTSEHEVQIHWGNILQYYKYLLNSRRCVNVLGPMLESLK